MGLLETDDDDEECGVGAGRAAGGSLSDLGFDLDDADGAANRAQRGATLDAESDAGVCRSPRRHDQRSINSSVRSGQRD
jgi:hypothetical protein